MKTIPRVVKVWCRTSGFSSIAIPAGMATVMALALLEAPAPPRNTEPSLATAPPVVVKTEPVAGASDVDPALTEIKVTFSKTMQDGSWSWSTWGEENFPEMVGRPKYLADGRTCVLTVRLQPDKFYATWLNSEKFRNFKDTGGQAAVPYLLTFRTASAGAVAASHGPDDNAWRAKLNDSQRLFVAWTDRQFRGFFDERTFAGWSASERSGLEARLMDALNGPQSRDYYQAINTLGALRSTNAVAALRHIAFERVDKDNRDRWMAVRALGNIGDKSVVPEMISLVYHGNVNTRWWAQVSLVRLTGQNFGGDWTAWGSWWNRQGGQPAYNPEIIRWWTGQVEPERLAENLADGDRKFIAKVKASVE
jgi:hypothetical protein